MAVRETPHWSVVVMAPQVAPSVAHSSASVSGLHSHTLPKHSSVLASHELVQMLDSPQAFVLTPHAMPLHEGEGHSHSPALLQTVSFEHEPQVTCTESPQLLVTVCAPH